MGDKKTDDLEGLQPESLMMSYGYRPDWSEGAVKPPIFQTSTFVFETAEKGKEFFSYAYGLKERDPSRPMGLIYSRLNNPDIDILEHRLNLWDSAEASATFSSGMAAITTTILALVKPGQGIVFTRPVYEGTDYLFEHILPEMGIATRTVLAGADPSEADAACRSLAEAGTPCRILFVETPANPTNVLTDIAGMSKVAHEHGALCAVDNTLLGPLYQHPLPGGADLVLYSATNYLGGHSDVVAGVALGCKELIGQVKDYRTVLGTTLDPHSAWLLLRSLETAKLRITRAHTSAEQVARWLEDHPKVSNVYYPGLTDDPVQKALYGRQCSGAGALVAFDINEGGEREAFQFLNNLQLIKLAASLGGTESLCEHPATMTHADVPPEEQLAIGLTPAMVRISVGIEHPDDIITDIKRALEAVDVPVETAAEAAATTE